MHITTIAMFVQSIRNQFIIYDCKNKLCTCQPILLIFSGNNFFCQKDDIQHFETFKSDTNYRNFLPHPPLKKIQWIYTDLKNDQDNEKKRGNPWIHGKLSSLSYMDTILKLTIGVNLTFTLEVEPGTRRIPSMSKQCFSKNPIIWRKERDLHESVSLTYTIRFIFDQLDKNRWWSIKFTIDIQ